MRGESKAADRSSKAKADCVTERAMEAEKGTATCLEFDARSLKFNAWSLEFGVWSLTLG